MLLLLLLLWQLEVVGNWLLFLASWAAMNTITTATAERLVRLCRLIVLHRKSGKPYLRQFLTT